MDGKDSSSNRRPNNALSREHQLGTHPTPQYTFAYSGDNNNNSNSNTHSLHTKHRFDYDYDHTTSSSRQLALQRTTKMSSTDKIHAAASDNNINVNLVGTGDLKNINNNTNSNLKTHNNNNNSNSRHNDTDNNNNAGDSSPDSNAPDLIKKPPESTCCRRRRCLYWLMGLALTASVLLVAALALDWLRIVNRYDTCIDHQPGGSTSLAEQNQYKLFATKTAYRQGQQELAKSRRGQRMRHLFGDDNGSKSLSQLVADLHDQGCQIRQLHYFGRHAARWPGDDDWVKLSHYMAQVQARIDLSKLGRTTNHSESQPQPHQTVTTNNSNTLILTNDTKTNLSQTTIPNETTTTTTTPATCYDPLVSYKQWRLSDVLGTEDSSDLITRNGLAETKEIALRYKSLFPDLFDANKVDAIDFGTTEKLRTHQTALVFMKCIDNLKLDWTKCKLEQFQSIDQSSTGLNRQANGSGPQVDHFSLSKDIEIASKIKNDHCLKDLSKRFTNNDLLYFHHQCKHWTKKQNREPVVYQYNLKDGDPSRTEFIAKSVSKKLKLNASEPLNVNQTKAIYDACRYETTISGSSIWCSLFSEQELKFYEYLNDVDDFFRTAYGYEGNSKPACVIGTRLFDAFNIATATNKTESNFYFTHSEVMQRLLALSTGLDADETYSTERVRDYLDRKEAPDEREWKNALLSPFSANIAFSVFKCPKEPKDVEEAASIRILAALNEQPILLHGCESIACKFNTLRDMSRLLRQKNCRKLEDYCEKEKHVFT